MSNKDFLSQFSNDNKPDSFKEEVRVPIKKEPKTVNYKLLIIILFIVLIITGLILFFIFRPTIEVEDFVGRKVNEVNAWIRQNDINAKGIIFNEEYSFDYDEGTIIYQSIESNKKVRKDVKMDFTVSLGANPDELIAVPDLMNMNKDEIQDWIKSNKLSKTKIINTYSDEVELNQVISYEFKNVEADSFTRSSTLTISVSKGPKPAGLVKVEDFVKKYYNEVELWANQNKIKLVKLERYSDDIDKDKVISQSVAANKEINEGDTLTVYVSLGKAVYAKNFLDVSIEEVNHWASKNGVYLITKEEYHNAIAKGKVIRQSISEGTIIDDEFTVVVSLGKPDFDYTGMTYDDLYDWVASVNEYGANISIGKKTYKNSDTVPVGQIISMNDTKVNGVLNPVISEGKNIFVKDYNSLIWTDINANPINYSEDDIRTLLEYNGLTYEIEYINKPNYEINKLVKVEYKIGNSIYQVNAGTYISEKTVVKAIVCETNFEE